MNTFTAICGHPKVTVGAPGSDLRFVCEMEPCDSCLDAIENGDDRAFEPIAKRIADQDAMIRQLSERVAQCSELLGRAAERHDSAERLRARIAELERENAELRGVDSNNYCLVCGAVVGDTTGRCMRCRDE